MKGPPRWPRAPGPRMCEQCAAGRLPDGYQRSWEQAIRECPRLQALGQPTLEWLITGLRSERGSAVGEPLLSLDREGPTRPQADRVGDQERSDPRGDEVQPTASMWEETLRSFLIIT